MGLFILIPLFALKIGLLTYLLIRPWRRSERARVLLDLIAIGLKQGWSPEATLVAASTSRDNRVPVRLHLLAAHIEEGCRFDTALDLVPDLVPTAIRRQLQLGVRTGTLPAMIRVARDSAGKPAFGDIGVYLPGLLFQFVIPWASINLGLFFLGAISPKYGAVFDDLMPAGATYRSASVGIPGLTLNQSTALAILLLGFGILGLHVWLFSRAAGPRLTRWIPLLDYLWLRVPWRRRRLQRDFAGTLAVLLDAGLPEEQALQEAGFATGNRVLRARAGRAAARLQSGVGLTEAVEAVFPAGELRWRLDAGRHNNAGFQAAFAGWLRALEESASRREAIAAQGFATAITLMNGLLVATIALGVFRLFVLLLEATAE